MTPRIGSILKISSVGRIAFAALLAAVLASFPAQGQSLAVRTNLLHDAAVIPTLGVEASFARDWSAGIDGSYIWIQDHRRDRHWRVEGGDVFLRRWIGKSHDASRFAGQHIGVYAQMYTFQIQLCNNHGFISGNPGHDLSASPLWAAGVEYGWAFPLGKHFNLDFSLGVGYCHAVINRYGRDRTGECGACGSDPYMLQKRYARNWVGPTRAEVALEWHFGPLGKGRGGK